MSNDNTAVLNGLTDGEVIRNRELYGLNVITPAEKESVFIRFLRKFKDPLIIILVVAGIFSIGISFYEFYCLNLPPTVFFEPIGIFIAVFLATGLGFFFEQQAEKEFAILNCVNDDEPVLVIRNNGNVSSIPRRDVVVDDIVMINTGNEIAADGILLQASQLTVDESTLTGEPACHKTTDSQYFDKEATFPSNHVMRGTKVLEGHGVMRVLTVGDSTESGKVFKAVQIDNSVKTPLNEQLDRLSLLITRVSYTIAAIIIGARTTLYFTTTDFEWVSFITDFLHTIMIAVALVAVSIPEGLPMAVTLSLAYSMKRMLKSKNLVRKMHACETMGAVTVICTDKTGTLTQNQMQVNDSNFFGLHNHSTLVAESIAVNSTAQLDFSDRHRPKALGNPTEGALLLWLIKNGVDYQKIRQSTHVVDELPFSTNNKYMATVVRHADGKQVIYVKGAPEIVLSMCDVMPDGIDKRDVQQMLLDYQNKAMRTLAFAYAILPDSEQSPISDGHITTSNLTFIGITAISDPVREDVAEAIHDCLDAGIRITIVTGDTIATTREVAREIGLWTDCDTDESIITGSELVAMTDEQLKSIARKIKIIARARPMDKKRFVETLQSLGDVVAATGDGTNDAPALKTAQVGLSMGDGTSVAKEASDITIMDNSFVSIRKAVLWGRSLYNNIRRFILFQMTVNVVACLIVLCGSFMGGTSPLTVTQMLWVNLIMDTFAAMALASLPPDHAVMNEKPRHRNDFIINKSMWKFIFGVGIGFFVILMSLLIYFRQYDVTSLIVPFSELNLNFYHDMTLYEQSLFFTIFVFLQFWNLFNARIFDSSKSAFNLNGCQEFIFILCLILIGQIMIISVGGQFFNVCRLKFSDWVVIISLTSLVAISGEIVHKIIRSKKTMPCLK